MKILLVGGGGREHALGWELASSPHLSQLISVPGNPGLAELGPTLEGVSPTDVRRIAQLAADQAVDLVVVGPEAPLAAGLADVIGETGIPVFGPSRAAARLESSKSFAKEVMARAGVPTPPASVFHRLGEATEYLSSSPGPYVVKADGLAGGKGVIVTEDRSEALAWAEHCFRGGLGEAGRAILVEEYAVGPEVSVFAMCDGKDAVALAPARDYKRLGDGDRGPNTGGMGSYSPVDLPEGLMAEALDGIIRPVVGLLTAEGIPYVGFLYAGLVLTDKGPQVLEFNVRLGDPESQALLPRLGTDLIEIMLACLEGAVGGVDIVWVDGAAVDVVLAAPGYPDAPITGDVITGLQEAEAVAGSLVFHAGTRRNGARLETAGGRVLNVVGLGATVSEARSVAYRAASHVSWPGMQFRTDIGRGA